MLFVFICKISFGQCADEETYSISPQGPYDIGDVVTVDYTLETFYQLNINWVIAFQINLGDGWTNLTPTLTPTNSNLNNVGQGSGYWIWDLENTYPSGFEFGPGFRFVKVSSTGESTAPDIINGVRASSINTLSTSSTIANA